MAELTKDAEDRMLDALFATEPLLDEGFSEKVVRKVRRRLWLRRMVLPIAALLGGAVAIEPLLALISSLGKIATATQIDLFGITDVAIPQFPVVLLGAVLFAATMLGTRLSEAS